MIGNGTTFLSNDESFLKYFLREGNAYIDAGANIGHLAFAAKSIVGNSGNVYASEANPHPYNYLTANSRVNGYNVNSFNCILSSSSGGELYVSNLHADDCNSIVDANDRNNHISVKAKSLDDVLSDLTAIRLLKIDIEGYEFQALKGAGKTLEITDIVYFEHSREMSRKYGYSSKGLYELFLSKGFKIYSPKALERCDYILSETTPHEEAITPIAMEDFGKDGKANNYISIKSGVDINL